MFAKQDMSNLSTRVPTIQKWENGAKHPNGLSLKLLSIVQKHGINILMEFMQNISSQE